MAWARVQSVANKTAGAGATTLTVTLGSTPTTGNKIILGITQVGTGLAPTSVRDSNSNNLTQMAHGANAGNCDVYLYAYDVPATPSTAITITFANSNEIGAVAQEISGLLSGNTTSMGDGTFATHTGSYSGAASTTTPTYSSTASNEYLVSVYGDFGNSATLGTPTGYTLDTNGVNTDSGRDCLLAYKNSTNASESVVWTATSNSGTNQYGVILGAFKLAAGGTQHPSSVSGAASFTGAMPKQVNKLLAA